MSTNKVLLVMEADPSVERLLRLTLVHDFDYRVHHFNDVVHDMLKVIGIDPAVYLHPNRSIEEAIRHSLIEWGDTGHHQGKIAAALWNRVRPLARVGRAMCLMGVRERDLASLQIRAQADKVEMRIWDMSSNSQIELPIAGSPRLVTSPAEIQHDRLRLVAIRSALTTLGLL